MTRRSNASGRKILAAICLAGIPWAVSSQDAWTPGGPMIYPAQGQSPEQMAKDRYECHIWAVRQTGYDPTRAAAAGSSGSAGREAVRGGARGAALGAAIGAIAGDAGKGAAIGATAGGLTRGARTRSQNQAASQADSAARANYQRALDACLQGRGYTVR